MKWAQDHAVFGNPCWSQTQRQQKLRWMQTTLFHLTFYFHLLITPENVQYDNSTFREILCKKSVPKGNLTNRKTE